MTENPNLPVASPSPVAPDELSPPSDSSSTIVPAAGPRFGLFTLMLLMVVFCVMGAAGFYLMRSIQNGTSPRAVFVMFTLAAPGVLVIVMSMSRIVLRWFARH